MFFNTLVLLNYIFIVAAQLLSKSRTARPIRDKWTQPPIQKRVKKKHYDFSGRDMAQTRPALSAEGRPELRRDINYAQKGIIHAKRSSIPPCNHPRNS